jgi:hypothetical protein
VQHCKHLLFHEATFLRFLCENPFCLAPGTFTFTLCFSFKLFVRGEAGRDGTANATDERAYALSETGRELGDGRVWGMRALTP